MSYPITPIPATTEQLAAEAFNRLTAIERRLMFQIGQGLDQTFNAVWSPTPPVTPQMMAAAAGANFLPRLALHAQQAALLLAQEAANGIQSSKHPWAIPSTTGGVATYAPGVPAGWTITPTVDANGNQTGAATVSYAPSAS
jgi:hypothetical protein